MARRRVVVLMTLGMGRSSLAPVATVQPVTQALRLSPGALVHGVAKPRSIAIAALVATGIAGCGVPPPTGALSSTPSTTGSPAESIGLDVRFAGTIHCAAFPYSCAATLSALEPDTAVSDAWRPPASDPWWAPASGQAGTSDPFDPTPVGVVPALAPGRHRLVISLLGSYDTPSYNPDGSRGFDLLGWCLADVDVQPGSEALEVAVTFVPDASSFRATCSMDVSQR